MTFFDTNQINCLLKVFLFCVYSFFILLDCGQVVSKQLNLNRTHVLLFINSSFSQLLYDRCILYSLLWQNFSQGGFLFSLSHVQLLEEDCSRVSNLGFWQAKSCTCIQSNVVDSVLLLFCIVFASFWWIFVSKPLRIFVLKSLTAFLAFIYH